LAHYKCPTSVDFADTLPRTTTGKVQKFFLRERYWADRDRRGRDAGPHADLIRCANPDSCIGKRRVAAGDRDLGAPPASRPRLATV
jgi:hypothetical protein